MRTATLLTAAILLAGCGQRDAARQSANASSEPSAAPGNAAAQVSDARWDLQSSGEGVALAFLSSGETAAIRLFCPAGTGQLIVNVPAFRPIGSEERLSFGSGGEVAALVADPAGDVQRGGVTGAGPVPGNLAVLIAGSISASYGAQSSGPHPAPPRNLAAEFAGACASRAARPVAPKPTPAAVAAPALPTGACLTQDGEPVPANRLRAVGTEPFWGARIDGRCVTYSHPEDQSGHAGVDAVQRDKLERRLDGRAWRQAVRAADPAAGRLFGWHVGQPLSDRGHADRRRRAAQRRARLPL